MLADTGREESGWQPGAAWSWIGFMLLLVTIWFLSGTCSSQAADPYPTSGIFQARDTLLIENIGDPDVEDSLAGFEWMPVDFDVRLAAMPEEVHGKPTIPACLALRFPSPKPIGEATVDEVVCELYVARDRDTGQIVKRPAVIVVHESGSGMQVGRLIAIEAARRGLHSLMVQLPGYGSRRPTAEKITNVDLVGVFKQGVCDVRRARDAAAALPFVDSRHIALQGTSLGGFVATLAGSLDGRFDDVYLLLCGGNIHRVLTEGGQDAAKALERIKATGVGVESLEELLRPIEPLRIAQRLDPQRTWLFSANMDDVVPPSSADVLSKAIGLEGRHHQIFWADHYSGIVYLPGVLHQIHANAMSKIGK